MMQEISKNDYGKDADEHLAAIQAEFTGKTSSGILPWHPREVLELERWAEPERRSGDKPSTGQRGHLKRLFACNILLRNASGLSNVKHPSDEEFFIDTSAATLIQLTLSAIALDEQPSWLTMRFILWLHGQQTHPTFSPFVGLCILLLATRTRESLGIDFVGICEWLEKEEARCREIIRTEPQDRKYQRWLIGLNHQEGSTGRRERWIDSASELLAGPTKTHSPATLTALRRVVNKINGITS